MAALKIPPDVEMPPALTVPATATLPNVRFGSSGLSSEEAFEAWREIMARMFLISQARAVDTLPRGGVSSFLVGDVFANRSVFNAQRLTRDAQRIEATADHLVLQLYRFGGFAGEMGSGRVRIAKGQIAICDLRRPLDVEAVPSETIGLSIPRHLLDGVALAALPSRLDPFREQLLAAHITSFHLRLPTLAEADIPLVTSDLITALDRLFDPSRAAGALEGRGLDADLLTLAERVIARELASPHLSPSLVAERLRVSRASLYRVFAPVGGIMHRVWTLRLESVRAALERPFETRSLSRLAVDHGFKTAAHLSRLFRARYGAPPRDWRAQKRSALPQKHWRNEAAKLNDWWRSAVRD